MLHLALEIPTLTVEELSTFVITCFFYILIPGPSIVLCVAYTTLYGWKKGLYVVVGIIVGRVFCVILVVFDIGRLLAQYPILDIIFTCVGIIYFVYIATKSLRINARSLSVPASELLILSNGQLFVKGMISGLVNPKSIIFLSSFIPYYIQVKGDIFSQYVRLSSIYLTLIIVIFLGLLFIVNNLRAKQLSVRTKLFFCKLAAGVLIVMSINMLLHLIKSHA